MHEIKCNIKGRVQLVMFRDFTKRKASNLGLSGLVRNLKDGSVEVLAQGEKDDLEKYIELLKKGPILANVKNVEIEWRKPTEEFNDFKIVY